MSKKELQIFGGSGFIGKSFTRGFGGTYHFHELNRNRTDVTANDILYFISTISNYNVLDNPYIDIETNLIHLMRVLEKAKAYKDRCGNVKFNFVSSWFVYGDTDYPAKESSPCNPKGFYSITKRAAEQLLISYCETYNINYRILRLANVVGPGDGKASKQKNALQYLLNRIKNNEPIELYDDGNIIRDYIHLYDVVPAISRIIELGDLNEIYNVGNGSPIKFKDIIDTAVRVSGSTSKITCVPIPRFHEIVQVRDMYLNNSKLQVLGYEPYFKFSTHLEGVVKGLMNL